MGVFEQINLNKNQIYPLQNVIVREINKRVEQAWNCSHLKFKKIKKLKMGVGGKVTQMYKIFYRIC